MHMYQTKQTEGNNYSRSLEVLLRQKYCAAFTSVIRTLHWHLDRSVTYIKKIYIYYDLKGASHHLTTRQPRVYIFPRLSVAAQVLCMQSYRHSRIQLVQFPVGQ